jgi:hypothetical protein
MLDVGDALRREQRREDVAVLAGLAGSERGERPDRQAEVEAHAVEVAGADAGAGQYEQTVLGQELPELVHDREDRVRAAIHDGASADFHDLKPGEKPDRAPASDGAGEFTVEEGLARERRGDVLDAGGVVGQGMPERIISICRSPSAATRLSAPRQSFRLRPISAGRATATKDRKGSKEVFVARGPSVGFYPLALRAAEPSNNSIGVPAEIGAFDACQKQTPSDRKRLNDFAFTPNTAPQNAPQPAGTVCGKGRDRGARPEIARTIARRQQFDIGRFWPDNNSPEPAPRP